MNAPGATDNPDNRFIMRPLRAKAKSKMRFLLVKTRTGATPRAGRRDFVA